MLRPRSPEKTPIVFLRRRVVRPAREKLADVQDIFASRESKYCIRGQYTRSRLFGASRNGVDRVITLVDRTWRLRTTDGGLPKTDEDIIL